MGAAVAAVIHQPLYDSSEREMILSDGENLPGARRGQAWFLCSCCHALTPSLPVGSFGPPCSSGTVLTQGKEQPSSLELWLTKEYLVLALTLTTAGPWISSLPF